MELYPEQFYVEVMRGVVWGIQPMICNLTEGFRDHPKYAGIYRFILETARFYYAHRSFLFDGDMENPSGFSCETKSVKFLTRGIFTKKEFIMEQKRQTPVILHAVWCAPDRSRALILGNITDSEQAWHYGSFHGTLAGHGYVAIPLSE